MSASTAERIQRLIAIDDDGCWLWTGTLDRYGYGKISVNGRIVKAHRASYEAWRGGIPAGLHLDHLCMVKACVNPDHLEPVTQAENMRRRGASQTHCLRGHPLSGENAYVTPKGRRMCRACNRAAVRRYQLRRVERAS